LQLGFCVVDVVGGCVVDVVAGRVVEVVDVVAIGAVDVVLTGSVVEVVVAGSPEVVVAAVEDVDAEGTDDDVEGKAALRTSAIRALTLSVALEIAASRQAESTVPLRQRWMSAAKVACAAASRLGRLRMSTGTAAVWLEADDAAVTPAAAATSNAATAAHTRHRAICPPAFRSRPSGRRNLLHA
jgi:hypothetical protein